MHHFISTHLVLMCNFLMFSFVVLSHCFHLHLHLCLSVCLFFSVNLITFVQFSQPQVSNGIIQKLVKLLQQQQHWQQLTCLPESFCSAYLNCIQFSVLILYEYTLHTYPFTNSTRIGVCVPHNDAVTHSANANKERKRVKRYLWVTM